MKIALVSDLHLEHAPIELPDLQADLLLLAGDIVPIGYLSEKKTDADSRIVKKRTRRFIEESLSKYKTVYHVLGNHEYYKGLWEDVAKEAEDYWAKHAPWVTVLNRKATLLGGGFRIWGGTLWTDFAGGNPVHMEVARYSMNDYQSIKKRSDGSPYLNRYVPITPYDTQEEHENCRYELKEAIEEFPDDSWIVMTHHLPSWRSIDDIYAGSPLNWAYASDLDPFIENHPQIKTWVHGHSHRNSDYTIGTTRVIANPRGYASPNRPNSPENGDFNPSFTFEL